MTRPDNEQPRTPAKWHESVAAVAMTALFAIIVTSPCWALVLLVAVVVIR